MADPSQYLPQPTAKEAKRQALEAEHLSAQRRLNQARARLKLFMDALEKFPGQRSAEVIARAEARVRQAQEDFQIARMVKGASDG